MCSYILTNHDVSFWNAGLMSKFSGRINCWTKAIFSESWSLIFASSGIEANTRANNFVMTYFSRPCIWSKPRGKAISKYRKHYIVMEFYQEKNVKQSFLWVTKYEDGGLTFNSLVERIHVEFRKNHMHYWDLFNLYDCQNLWMKNGFMNLVPMNMSNSTELWMRNDRIMIYGDKTSDYSQQPPNCNLLMCATLLLAG